MSDGAAFAIPCRGCGAPLPVDLEAHVARCTYCRVEQAIPREVVERLRAHERSIASFESRARHQRDFADDARQDLRNQGRGYIVALVWVFALAAFCVPMTLVPLVLVSIIDPLWLLVEVASLAALVLTLVGLKRYKKNITREAGPIVKGAALGGRAGCTSCGATLPVVAGEAMSCPFCNATLLPDAVAARAAEAAAADVASREADAASKAWDRSFFPMYGMMAAMVLATIVYAILYEPPGGAQPPASPRPAVHPQTQRPHGH